MRDIDLIVVHCSDTPDKREHTAADIDRWHKERGFDRIGYHYVIRRGGMLEVGRAENEVGAHVKNHNQNSIGICLIGRSDFTDPQNTTLGGLLRDLRQRYPDARILGHCDLDKGKTCPNFNVQAWVRQRGIA